MNTTPSPLGIRAEGWALNLDPSDPSGDPPSVPPSSPSALRFTNTPSRVLAAQSRPRPTLAHLPLLRLSAPLRKRPALDTRQGHICVGRGGVHHELAVAVVCHGQWRKWVLTQPRHPEPGRQQVGRLLGVYLHLVGVPVGAVASTAS